VSARETFLRIGGREVTVRTETGGKIRTVKQLEAAHTKAVKDTIAELRLRQAEECHQYTEPDETGERDRWYRYFTNGKLGPLPRAESERCEEMIAGSVAKQRREARAAYEKARKNVRVTAHTFSDVRDLRKPHPPVKYTYPEVVERVQHLMEES
jgi:hypothetical protein